MKEEVEGIKNCMRRVKKRFERKKTDTKMKEVTKTKNENNK